MIKIIDRINDKFDLVITNDEKNDNIITNDFEITEFVNDKKAFLYVKKIDDQALTKIATKIVKAPREYKINLADLQINKIDEIDFLYCLYEADLKNYPQIYNAKSEKPKNKNTYLYNLSSQGKIALEKIQVLTSAREVTMDLQMTPPNILNSETYASKVQQLFNNSKNVKINVLNKKTIENLQMGLLLSVNKGSAFEPRVVTIEYQGNPNSQEKTAIVGKGITFDAGGYNVKTGKYMSNMKFDMSGSASVVGTMLAISKLQPKANVVGILVISDNMISSNASTPDSVWKAMNGKSVEINNTDAEGRLALADGMVYAKQKLNATRTITIATLTGAVIAALGSTYTGVWATNDQDWDNISKAAKKAHENIWRMPLHQDFFKYMQSSKVADMFNTDLTGKGGSSSAAMFLSQFREGNDFIHLDIAGSSDIDGFPQGVMVKTLFEVVNA